MKPSSLPMEPRQSDPVLKTVAVTASSRKAGKSTLACMMVRNLKADFALKVSTGEHGEAGLVITDPAILGQPGTDTARLMEAGARQVAWVNLSPGSGISQALDLFQGPGILVIEGNTALGYLDPDFTVFLMSAPLRDFKPSAHLALARADLVITDLGMLPPGRRIEEELREVRTPGRSTQVFVSGESEREAAYHLAVEEARRRLGT